MPGQVGVMPALGWPCCSSHVGGGVGDGEPVAGSHSGRAYRPGAGLHSAGHPATSKDEDGVRLIERCAYYGDVSAVRLLLDRGESLGIARRQPGSEWRGVPWSLEALRVPDRERSRRERGRAGHRRDGPAFQLCAPSVGTPTISFCGCCWPMAPTRTARRSHLSRPAASCATAGPGRSRRSIGRRRSAPRRRSTCCSRPEPPAKPGT